MPEMEQVTASPVSITNDYYGDMMITAWLAAAQGDIYMLSDDMFQRYAPSGAFMDLQPYVDSGCAQYRRAGYLRRVYGAV